MVTLLFSPSTGCRNLIKIAGLATPVRPGHVQTLSLKYAVNNRTNINL